jgi:excisionase family DNA binding protein
LKTTKEKTVKTIEMKRPDLGAPINPAVMTLREAAAFLHCHTSTLYRLANNGEIPAFRLGGSWRFTWEALERWMRRDQ